jgi:hypothetical protein
MNSLEPRRNLVDAAIEAVVETALRGAGPVAGAEQLARRHAIGPGRPDAAAMRALVRAEVTKAAATGLVAGLAGPAGLPAGLAAGSLVQVRLALAIATLRGHSLDSRLVRRFVAATLAGEVGAGFARRHAARLSGPVLCRLLGRFCALAPVLGAPIAGAIDGVAAYLTARAALRYFAAA